MTQTGLDGGNNNVKYGVGELDEDNASNALVDKWLYEHPGHVLSSNKDKMLLLASVIQKLIGEFQEVHSYSTAHHLSKLHQDLKLNVRENLY